MSNTNERPQHSIKLEVTGQEVVVRDWITGREKEAIEKPVQQSVEMKPNSMGDMVFGNVDAEKILESTHKAIEAVVVSVNGKTEDVLNAVLDLPVADYNTIISYVNTVTGGKKKE